MLMASLSYMVLAASKVITGKVTDNYGEALIGAHVQLKGSSSIATVTDSEGNYRLQVPAQKTYQIQVSYVGFMTQTVTIGGNGSLKCDFTLQEDATSLETVVVTATHTPKALKDVPVVTRLITATDIKKVDATNIQDMLTQELPGLEFGFAMSQETSLNMSGFGGNAVLFLVDGERLAGETMDNTDYNRLNLDNVGRIEIVKGASSALYGSNAVGGVINIISRESTQPWTANVNSRYSSMGNEWRNGANFSFNKGKWNSQTNFQQTKIDPIQLSAGMTAEERAIAQITGQEVKEDKSNIKKLYGNETYNLKERLTYKWNDNFKLIARGGYFYRESQRDTYNCHYNAYSAGLKGAYDWKDGRNLEVSYAFDRYDKANFNPDGTRTHDHDYNNTQHVAHAIYNQEFGQNVLTVGADYLHDYLTTYQFLDNSDHAQTNADAYAQFDYNPTKRLNLVGSVRYDYFSASEEQALTARLAAVYKFSKLTVRANYASGFRAPSLKEMYMHYDMGNMGYMIIGNPDLKPEKSNNFNLALEHAGKVRNGGFLDGDYNLTLMGYANIFDKRITSIGRYWVVNPSYADGGYQVMEDDPNIEEYEKAGDTAYRYKDSQGVTREAMTSSLYWNEEGITVFGVDVSANYHFNWGLGLKYNFTWMHESGNVVDSQFTQPRKYSMTWRADYDRQFTRHWGANFSLSGRNLGKPQSNRTDVDQGYTIWKFMMQNRIWKGINLNLTVDNLLNYKPEAYYYCSCMTTGRSWSVGVSIDIDRIFE